MTRGPLRKVGVRPPARSVRFKAEKREGAEPRQRISRAMFQKRGWSAKPTGSLS